MTLGDDLAELFGISHDQQALVSEQAGHADDGQTGYLGQLFANYARNMHNARPEPAGDTGYITPLTPQQTDQFHQWMHANHVPWNPNAPVHDYDMPGFWKAQQQGAHPQTGVNPFDHRLHFTDRFKTPYDTTFSNQSQYAKPSAPHWVGNRFLVNQDGTPVFDAKFDRGG